MSIKKITQKEILENGVQSLPTRPSSPSLYKGKLLSAEELKAAFDQLPTLIAERFNTLLASTGLFDEENPKDAFAELIATELAPSHSLKNFFEDVKSGNLALYLAADAEGTPLFDLLAELKQLIDDKKSYTVSIEGDGDLLTDASFADDALTLVRGTSRESILAEAKAYTDNPTGEVESSCTAPVSGESVHLAIEKASAEQSRRIRNLENAAKDILYTYPEEKESFTCKVLDGNILSNTALLKMGASPAKQRNLFPEGLFKEITYGDLTVTMDPETKEIVLNGTLPADTYVSIGSFPIHSPATAYVVSCHYRSGSPSTDDTLILISSPPKEPNYIFLLQENTYCAINAADVNPTVSLELYAASETVYTDYRVHLKIAERFADYVPFYSGYHFTIPKGLRAQAPNLWQGEKSLIGEEYVSFVPPQLPGVFDYIIGFRWQGTKIQTTVAKAMIYTEDGLYTSKIFSTNNFKAFPISTHKPITEIRVYPTLMEAQSVGHTIAIRDIYVEALLSYHTESRVYTEPGCDEILFPESLSRFASKYLGFGDENCNYFDFENGVFKESVKILSLDSSLDFEADPSTPCRFSAPFPVPPALQSEGALYRPSSFFSALTDENYEKKLWFTADRVFIQSDYFAGMNVSEVRDFFHRFPIDVVYVDPSNQTITHLTEEETAFYDRIPTILTRPYAYFYFFDENGDPIETYSHMQYQVKEASL